MRQRIENSIENRFRRRAGSAKRVRPTITPRPPLGHVIAVPARRTVIRCFNAKAPAARVGHLIGQEGGVSDLEVYYPGLKI